MSKTFHSSKIDLSYCSPKSRSYKLQGIDFSVIRENDGKIKNWELKNELFKNNATKECISLENHQLAKFYFHIHNFKIRKSNKTWSVLLLDFYTS